MKLSFEEVLVEQCAATLAGVKSANLFRYVSSDLLEGKVRYWNNALEVYGITVEVIKRCKLKGCSLIYVYRKSMIRDILLDSDNIDFLRSFGYEEKLNYRDYIYRLTERLCLEDFPHEIGIFLGYPLEDVKGFIIHKGQNYTYADYWKAYGDPDVAKKRFDQYRDCTSCCKERFSKGDSIIALVA